MLKKILRMIAQRGKDIILKYELNSIFTKDKGIDQGYTEYINDIYSKQISQSYNKSYDALKHVTKDFAEFPTIPAWNKYAKEHDYLNHISLQYIVKLEWKEIQKMVEGELYE